MSKQLKGSLIEAFRDTLIIFNGFIHDLSIGIWFGALLVMNKVLVQARQAGIPEDGDFASGLLKTLWPLSVASFAIMLATGGARVFTLKHYGWTGDIARGRKRLLIIKHIVLGFIVVIGLVIQVRIHYSL